MNETEEIKIMIQYPDNTLVNYRFSLTKGMLKKVEKAFLNMVNEIEQIKRENDKK